MEGHTEFRAPAARVNYLEQDRIDIQFPAKEVCRFVGSLTETSKAAVKRMGRYLIGHKRMVYTYPFQRAEGIDVYSDTDWSGCPRTRLSTSGGCIMIGKHCIRTWSSTQPSVTLSSGEAEFYGLVKAAGAGLGHQSLLKDIGLNIPVCVWTDSSAALGIASRSGLGKLRHLETHTLWVQEKVRTKAISVRKVRGEVNPADLFTKHLPSKDKVHQLLNLFGCEYRTGRAESAPLLRPHGSDSREGGHSSDGNPLPTFQLEAELHDERTLPHLYEEADVEKMFPSIAAAEAQPNAEDWDPGAGREELEREHGGAEGGRDLGPRGHGGAQAGRDLGVRGHGGAAATTGRRKLVRRNIGAKGERASEKGRLDDSIKTRP